MDAADPSAIYNARVARALLRCVRSFPSQAEESRGGTEITNVVMPVIKRLSRRHRFALLEQVRADSAKDSSVFSDDAVEPSHIETHWSELLAAQDAIGPILCSRKLVAGRLLDAADQALEKFLAGRRAPIDGNVEILGKVLGLSAFEHAFLNLAASAALAVLDSSLLSFVKGSCVNHALEALFDVTAREAETSRRATSTLTRSGLFDRHIGFHSSLDDCLALSAIGFRLLTIPIGTHAEMARAILKPLLHREPAAMLHWPHLAAQQQMVEAVLRSALNQAHSGINILLHGGPGTGKTEFARLLVERIAGTGFEVGSADESGSEWGRTDRLASLRLNQLFATRQDRSVLVLDEAEDIFQNDYQNPLSRIFDKKSESKAWINQVLENNTHPVIWITNDAGYLDPAYLRRFTFCLEFPQTPLSLRRQIAENVLLPIGCGTDTIEAAARDEASSPALLASAAKFAGLAKAAGADPGEAALMHLHQQALVQGRKSAPITARLTQRFDLRYLNIEGNAKPAQVIQALQCKPTAALMFGGPPGTGKTQFAAEIARQLDRLLVVKTASDINSMWYGQSEANVAKMFRSCDPSSELLFLDEADVLLGARESAGHRADKAVTAEFLRWLECFDGIFICATNHASTFDAALMRRFEFRLEFLPLSLAQRRELFAEQALGWHPASGEACPELDPMHLRRLQAMDHLTPGDFANAGRRARRLGLDLTQWLTELEAEHAAKADSSGGKQRMGFI